ncbi:hypothetical protein QU668_04020 [Schaalia sp. HMT-877]|nr:hypothetical protein HMPREF1550_00847 [Actinomyces sp. oral taxon 877 str. F0543]WLD80914.1 hypothetical protein QU668_04020 [Schaalia sp. HMT-877]
MWDIPNWVSAIFAALTGIGTLFAWLHANASKKAKAEAERAKDEATRLVEAAERTASGVRQLADALNEANSAPPWVVRWRKGDTFELVNTGNTPAVDVHAEVDEDGESFTPPPDGTIDAKSSAVFWYSRHIGSPPNVNIVVTWTRPDGARRTWKGPIPPRGDR